MRMRQINSFDSSILADNRSKLVHQLNEHISGLWIVRYRRKFHIIYIVDIDRNLFILRNSILSFTLDLESHLAKLTVNITFVLIQYLCAFNVILREVTWIYTNLSALSPYHSHFLEFLDALIVQVYKLVN